MAPGNNGPWAGLPRCGGKGFPVGLAGQAGLGTLVPLGRGGRGALAPAWPRAADELGLGAGTGRSTAHLALLQALPASETSRCESPSEAVCCLLSSRPGLVGGAGVGSSHGLGRSEPAEPPGGGQGPGLSPLLSAEVVSELWLGTGHHSRCPVKMKCLTDGCQMASTSVHTCPRGLWTGSPCFWLSCPFAMFSQRCSPSPSGWGCWSWRSEHRPSGPKPLGLGRGHTRELGGARSCCPQAPGCCLPSSLPSLASSSLRTWSTAYDECCRHPAVSSAPFSGRSWLAGDPRAGRSPGTSLGPRFTCAKRI